MAYKGSEKEKADRRKATRKWNSSHKEYNEKWRKANPDKIKLYNKRTHFKYYCGTTMEWYEATLATQGGLCAICKCEPTTRALHVDHNHTTGQLRGLLCHYCNTALGALKESPAIMQAMIDYVKHYEGNHG